ncbi:hypothetical protein [Halomonas korlensis]|uniref:Uncharacterized protein n=1 Tax=Halomonas korlensis TaxID=463301 RepID=A0A1I7KM59_9GAMM|nr:hypothetical protein [Halomonas korlensis]SFU98523.1 hypothetical protein SAMN04487955_12618 [Halomonas korlensis]
MKNEQKDQNPKKIMNQLDREALEFMREFAKDFHQREKELRALLRALEESQEVASKNYETMGSNYNQMAKNYEAMEKKFNQLLDENRALRQSLESLNSTLSGSEGSTRSASKNRAPIRREPEDLEP